MRCVELFAGLGGSLLGAARSGAKQIIAVERDSSAVKVVETNRECFRGLGCDLTILHKDVQDVSCVDLGYSCDILIAGSPCQPFSISGKRDGHNDERNGLRHVLRVVKELQPSVVVLENVPGLASSKFSTYFKEVLIGLRDCCLATNTSSSGEASTIGVKHAGGYEVHWSILNAADYGIPQTRRRIFIVCLKRSKISRPFFFPKPSHSLESLTLDQSSVGAYWKQHNISPPQIFRSLMSTRKVSQNSINNSTRWVTLRDTLNLLGPADIQTDDPWHVSRKGARIYKGHTGSFLDLPAKTIKAGVHGVPGGENMIRLSSQRARYLTIRECGILQGLPLDYQFAENFSTSMRLIGNAVPPLLAKAVIFEAIKCIH